MSELGAHYESTNLFRNHRNRNRFASRSGAPMEMKILFAVFIGTLIVTSAFFLFKELARLYKKVINLEKRMTLLEQAKNKRMSYEAFESILDARAALNKEKEEFQFFISLIENAEAHLEKAVKVGTKREEEK